MSYDTKVLELRLIRLDGGTQSRACLDEATLDDYTDIYLANKSLPDIVVFYDGAQYWLADGFHRVEAMARAQREWASCAVYQGTRRDAILYSVGANKEHGLRRTNEDKRRAVTVLLSDEEWSRWTDRAIGEKCGVSNRFVTTLRGQAVVNGSQLNALRTGKDGKQYPMKKSNATKSEDLDAKSSTAPAQSPNAGTHRTASKLDAKSVDDGEPPTDGAVDRKLINSLVDSVNVSTKRELLKALMFDQPTWTSFCQQSGDLVFSTLGYIRKP